MAPIYAYWNFRGLAEPVRYLLHYVGVQFEDKRYEYTDQETWLSDKFQLGLELPNLPYYIDGDVKLTQSLAILRYLGRKHNLVGSNEREQTRIEIAEQQMIDLRYNFSLTAFWAPSEFENMKAQQLQKIPDQFKMLSKFIGENKWLTGENITYVDFLAYETFDFYWLLIPDVMKYYPVLKRYVERFEKLPGIESYLKSDKYQRWPIYPSRATFGGSGEEPKRES